MLLALLLLVAILSVLTWDKQSPTGAAAGRVLAGRVAAELPRGKRVAIIARDTAEDTAFAQALATELKSLQVEVATVVNGNPPQARRALDQELAGARRIDLIAASEAASEWAAVQTWAREAQSPAIPVLKPVPYYWPNVLKTDNLLNIGNQIAVIAIIAIGMTMVIITGGIDLSVGSLIALSAVLCTRLVRDYGGGVEAGLFSLVWCSLAAILFCGLIGLTSGLFITLLRVPAFIVTLAMMLLAEGLAYDLAGGATINEVPPSFSWFCTGTLIWRLPNSVILTAGLYLLAHLVMTHTVFGRHLYAVGGNRQAAWLCGVPVQRVTIAAYVICAALAGLGGVLLASQFAASNPNLGAKYELLVIAAVVVGGTSLSGGRGKMGGTLIGALILAVIANGMNLIGLESKRQQIVYGLVILSAVVLDRVKLPRQE